MSKLIRFPRARAGGDQPVQWQGFYSSSQVSRLARVPRRTLSEWKARRIVVPSVRIVDDTGKTVDEGYSYEDLAIIKLIRALRNKQLNLQSVAASVRHLYDRLGPPNSPGWTNAHVYIEGKDVYVQKPDEWDTTIGTRGGQRAETRVLGELFEEKAALIIPRGFDDYIEINLNVMDGQPVVRNTRVLTATIATMYAQGISISQLAYLYRPIPKATIQKAIDFEKSLDQELTKASA